MATHAPLKRSTAKSRKTKVKQSALSTLSSTLLLELYRVTLYLPDESVKEVLDFAKFLRSKSPLTPRKRPVQLGGLWANENLDMAEIEKEIRQMRRESLEHLEQEFANG
jgi:hypothetical protein